MAPSASKQALRRSGHSAIAARTVSRGMSADAFKRDLFRLSSCCDAFGKPCPPKQPTVYSPGG